MLEILNTNESTVEVITQSGLRGYVNADEFILVESAVNDKLIEKIWMDMLLMSQQY